MSLRATHAHCNQRRMALMTQITCTLSNQFGKEDSGTEKVSGHSAPRLFTLADPANGKQYKTYCDFEIDKGNGGWTLVASVHEDNLG